MTTIINLNDSDFKNLLTTRKTTISLKESNSFAVTTQSENEVVAIRNGKQEIKAVVTQRLETAIDENTKLLNLSIKIIQQDWVEQPST